MKRVSMDAWIAAGLVAILIIITILVALNEKKEDDLPLSSFSSSPNGALAMKLWLEEMGYRILDPVQPSFEIPQNVSILLFLEPTQGVSDPEWEVLDTWVESGGALLLAGQDIQALLAFRHYDADLQYGDARQEFQISAPLAAEGIAPGTVSIDTNTYFTTSRRDYLPLATTKNGLAAISFSHGKGQVILLASAKPFSNAGLKNEQQAALVLNLIRYGQSESALSSTPAVMFNEWHHGLRQVPETPVTGPEQWLRYTPGGQALLFSVLMIFLALVLSGRRFGRPLRPVHEIQRRSPVEYITALANLSRQAGHHSAILQQYRLRLKRQLAHRYRLDPTLPDEEYVEKLKLMRPEIESASLLRLLNRLSNPKVRQHEFVELAQEASQWLKNINE